MFTATPENPVTRVTVKKTASSWRIVMHLRDGHEDFILADPMSAPSILEIVTSQLPAGIPIDTQ